MNLLYKFIIFFLLSALLTSTTSCSYDKTQINLGSTFKSTWSFNTESDYNYDTTTVEIINGVAQLKPLDLEHSGDDFTAGFGPSTSLLENKLTIKNDLTNLNTNVKTILPDRQNQLIGYWRLDNNYLDSSLNTNNGTSVGDTNFASPSFIPGEHSTFDGIGDYIDVGNDTSLHTNSLTISFWAKPNNNSTSFITKGISRDGIAARNWGVYGDGSSLRFVMSSGVSNIINVNGAAFPEIGLWSHIVVTWDGTLDPNAVKLYLNGSIYNTATASGTSVAQDHNLYLGGRHDTLNYEYNGALDEVAIWNQAISEEEVYQLYQNQVMSHNELSPSWTPYWNQIVGYWKMDSSWQDSSPNINHCNPTGSISITTSQYKIGAASGNFPGTGSSCEVGTGVYDFSNTNNFSSFAWIKTSFTGDNYILGTEINTGWYMRTNSSSTTLLVKVDDGINDYFDNGTTKLNDGNWHHVGLVKKADRLLGYVNGQQEINIPVGTLNGLNDNFTIGRVSGNYFNGQIDDIAIWSTDLSPSDVQTLYNQQKQKYSSSYSSEVINLGHVSATWPDLSWSTSLPFGKELIGDYNNDGAPDSENISSYPSWTSNLNLDLVGYWPLNETTLNNGPLGSDLVDKSGNGNHANESGGITLQQRGKLLQAVQLDGLDDLISVPDNANLNFGATTNFTLSGWVRTSGAGNEMFISKEGGTSGNFTTFASHNATGKPRGYLKINGAAAFCTVDGSISINDGQWHFLTFIYNRQSVCDADSIQIFVNGQRDTGAILAGAGAGSSNFDISNTNPLKLGFRDGNILNGHLDELAVWSRALTPSEIQQLYRRGSNRVKLQVKSCIDSSCNCKSYGAGGSETDCDGDTILNTVDIDDSHKAEFIGPGGDGTTYYSELYNRNTADITFNCALNTSDDNPGVCVEDEISLTSASKPTGPEFLNIDYTQFITPAVNRFAQYRVYMEADDNTACGGEPCLPDLTRVNLNPTGVIKYSSEFVEVKPKSPIQFTQLLGLTIEADICATFRLERNSNEYYHNNTEWVIASDTAHRNTAKETTDHILQFANQYGSGSLQVNGYLKSDPSQSSPCSIDEIDFRYK